MPTLIQIIAVIFGTFAVSRALLRAKDKKISLGELLFWLTIWSGLVFVVFFPSITGLVADVVGIGRGIDVIIYASIGLLFYLIFRLYVKLEETQQDLTKIVRELAIMNKKRK